MNGDKTPCPFCKKTGSAGWYRIVNSKQGEVRASHSMPSCKEFLSHNGSSFALAVSRESGGQK